MSSSTSQLPRGESAARSASRGRGSSADKSPAKAVIQSVRLKKTYRKGKVEIPVLHGVDLAARPGEFLAIVGQSGSGKSTLLHVLGTLDRPDAGEVRFQGQRIDNLPAR